VSAQTTQLIVPDTNFTSLIGFTNATFPAVIQTTTQSFLSTTTPQVSPVQSLILTCNLLNNKFSIPSTILYSFAPSGVSFGNIIDSAPNEYLFVPIQDGAYTELTIEFLDQNFNKLLLNDTNLIVQLLIKNPL